VEPEFFWGKRNPNLYQSYHHIVLCYSGGRPFTLSSFRNPFWKTPGFSTTRQMNAGKMTRQAGALVFDQCFVLSAVINNVTTDDSSLFHQIINLLQLAQPDCFEGRFDEAFGEELDRFGRVSAVADVGAFD